jgi:ribosomal protein S18 acetylase RimI-like enzyme
MKNSELLERMEQSLIAFWNLLAISANGSQIVEYSGGTAAVFPSPPERDVFNNTLITNSRNFNEKQLRDIYQNAGIKEWNVWFYERDTTAQAKLEASGYEYNDENYAMSVKLANLSLVDLQHSRISIETVTNIDQLTSLMSMDKALQNFPGQNHSAHLYLAYYDDALAGCLIGYDHHKDCSIQFGFTLPEFRRQGIGAAMTAKALLDARQRGCTTASTQTTPFALQWFQSAGFVTLDKIVEWTVSD